jgi:hypothetical protein
MTRERRKGLIEQLEELRQSRIATYVTSDRSPTPGQIGSDAVRQLYEHLRNLGHVKRLDLFLYSTGGAIDVPWRIVTALRAASDEWNVLIPFRANSAATLLALGADTIVLGQQGELGPIDPSLNVQRIVPQPGGGQGMLQDTISVEDVMAYTRFVTERAGLSDQDALAVGLSKLTDRMDAVSIGSLYRTHQHIRDVALLTLRTRSNPANEQTMAAIVETLAERVYAHGHAIGFKDAKEIGLPAQEASTQEDAAMWELLNEYEADMRILEPIDPAAVTAAIDVFEEDATIAVIESAWAASEFQGRIEIKVRRQMPQNFNLEMNLQMQLPPGVNVNQLPAAMQQALQAAQQQLAQQAQQAVQEAMRRQAPVAGIEAGFRNGRWTRID